MALINELTNIGNAIREKTGGTELIPLKEMASAIQGISSGGADTQLKDFIEGTTTELVDDMITHLASGECLRYFPLTKVDLPSLVSINSGSYFNATSNLVSLNIPNYTGSIGFYPCRNLTTVNCPKVKSIASNCFRECTKLTVGLKFESVTSIGTYSFEKANVTSLDFADTLTTLGKTNTFAFCKSLKKLIFRANKVFAIDNSTLSHTPIGNGTGFVYVPDDLVESYKTASTWSNYANQIKPLSELPD